MEANFLDGSIEAIELKLYDFLIQQHPVNPSSDVIIVELDDSSYKLIPESLPYPRSLWGEAIKNLANANAKVVVLEGDTGTGKTYILQKSTELLCQAGIPLSPNLLPLNNAIEEWHIEDYHNS